MFLAFLALEKETKTPGPRAEQRFPRARRAAHPRRGYSCYIYDRQAWGADRAEEGVWLWCAHPLAGADPVIIGEAQPLNGQGHAAREDARRCASV